MVGAGRRLVHTATQHWRGGGGTGADDDAAAVQALLRLVAGTETNTSPELCVLLTVTPPGQLSDTTGVVHVIIASQVPSSADTVIFAGQVIVGASSSTTVTSNEQVA